MIKTTRITIAGFGGQGVMMIGQLLAQAGNIVGVNSLWYPSYGPETRGGTANCAVIISNDYIASPVFSKSDVLIALNKPSLAKFEGLVDKSGVILYNSSLIEDFDSDVLKYGIPINEMATSLGNSKVSNLIMLGAYLEFSNLFENDIIEAVLKDYLSIDKENLFDINMKAFMQGRSYLSEKTSRVS